MSEKVLVVGPAGGREDALLWSIDAEGRQLFINGANAGTAQRAEEVNAPYVKYPTTRGVKALAQWAVDAGIDFTVAGPDNALAAGVVDEFQARGLEIFGPTQAAMRLESSKAWSGEFVEEYLPEGWYAKTQNFTNPSKIFAYVRQHDPDKYVVKDDGLAFGKGVEADPAKVRSKATEIVRRGKKAVFQERHEGAELSVFAICDGEHSVLLPTFRDYKRVFDGDKGPNTGGTGAYGPVPGYGSRFLEQVRKNVITPTLEGMQKEGAEFRGVLYVGLILASDGPKVIEYNARFGDPEFQAMALLLDEDLLELLRRASKGELTDRFAKIKPGVAMDVALMARGYPGEYQKGMEVYGLDTLPDDVIGFHGGTEAKKGKTIARGGRVVHLATRASSIERARAKIYGDGKRPGVIGKHAVDFAGVHYRSEIAQV